MGQKISGIKEHVPRGPTRKEFAEILRLSRNGDEEALHILCEDLANIEVLAKMVPDEELEDLEAWTPDAPIWQWSNRHT